MLSTQLRAVAGMPHKLALLQLQRLLRSQTQLLYAAALLESGVAHALRDWHSRRELIEETGYRATRVEPLGVVNPNPALFTNSCHTFLARNVEKISAVQNTAVEETLVELVPRAELRGRLRTGEIDHALVIAALHWFEIGGSAIDGPQTEGSEIRRSEEG